MGYDLRRAALVTCALLALLLAASLMPAVGLGSFPTLNDGTTSGVTVPTPGDPVTPDSTTVEATADTPETVTTLPPDSTVTTVEQTTATTAAPEPDDTDDSGGFPALITGIAWLGTLVLVGGSVVYGVCIFGGAAVFGASAVEWLPFSGTIRSIPQLTMSTLIGTSSATASFLDQVGTAFSGITGGIDTLLRSSVSLGSFSLSALVAPIRLGGQMTLGIGSALGSLSGALSNLSLGLGRRSGRDSGSETTTDARDADDTEPEQPSEETDPGPLSITEAWDRMTDELRVRNQRTRTPAEIADAAIERGWPAEPVSRLTDAFQEIRYGGREETAGRTESARSALDTLREFWRGSR